LACIVAHCQLSLLKLPQLPVRVHNVCSDLCARVQLTNDVLLALSEHCLQLRSLSISKNREMTDFGMLPLLNHCTQLHRLKMDECHGITAASVLALSLHCQGMQMLDVTGCENIPETSVHAAAGVRVLLPAMLARQ
jgi:hypothetical protein